jgi:hypothetical protein
LTSLIEIAAEPKFQFAPASSHHPLSCCSSELHRLSQSSYRTDTESSCTTRLCHHQVLLKHLLPCTHGEVVHVRWHELRCINWWKNCNHRISNRDHTNSAQWWREILLILISRHQICCLWYWRHWNSSWWRPERSALEPRLRDGKTLSWKAIVRPSQSLIESPPENQNALLYIF